MSLDSARTPAKISRVFRKLGQVLLITALIVSLGGHWAVLQSLAWANMLADNLREGCVSKAFEKTFDGEHPCCLCKAINEGKRSEKKSELPAPLKKFEFTSERSVVVFAPPQDFCLLPEGRFSLCSFSTEPPSPPPRPAFS